MKKVSEEMKAMIRQWEGCRLEAYRCPAGVWTIGYGHTGRDVYEGMQISKATADELLEADLARTAGQVARLVDVTMLTQCQFDAIVSLAYNIGAGALGSSTLLRKVRADSRNEAVGSEFMRWVYSGGRRQPGLVTRRRAEAAWYYQNIR